MLPYRLAHPSSLFLLFYIIISGSSGICQRLLMATVAVICLDFTLLLIWQLFLLFYSIRLQCGLCDYNV